jgi:hypothetical protein
MFGVAGWVFGAGGGHEGDAGEACCTCDNPPGSGTNTTGCANCPSGIAPASLALTFTNVSGATCLPRAVDEGVVGTLGSYCMNFGGCQANHPSGVFSKEWAPGSGCAGTVVGSFEFNINVTRFAAGFPTTGSLPCWFVLVSAARGSRVLFWSYIAGDCSTTVTLTDQTPAANTTFSIPGFSPTLSMTTSGTLGKLVLTPQFFTC